jgi:hypothetical protein
MAEFNGFDGVSSVTNPLRGIVNTTPQADPQHPQVVVDDGKSVEEEELEILQKQREQMQLMDKASRTKYASGDVERDIFNYKRMQGIIEGLLDLQKE